MKNNKKRREFWYRQLMGIVGNIQIAAKIIEFNHKISSKEITNTIKILKEQNIKLNMLNKITKDWADV